jgi:hypothetical protein
VVHEISLAESLRQQAGWEIVNFGYNGPNPPYVRIGLTLSFRPLRLRPCFESWLKDKVVVRSKVLIEDHLRPYGFISFSAKAVEDAFGRASAGTFPIDRWFKIVKVGMHDLTVGDLITDETAEIPMLALGAAGDVRLKRP